MVDIDERSNTVSWSVAVSLLFVFNVLPQVRHQSRTWALVRIQGRPRRITGDTLPICPPCNRGLEPNIRDLRDDRRRCLFPLRIGMDGLWRSRGMAVGPGRVTHAQDNCATSNYSCRGESFDSSQRIDLKT